MSEDRTDELKVLVKVCGLLDVLEPDERERILAYICERYPEIDSFALTRNVGGK
jgi:hypothetical protein